jgi:uncharacterized protein HemX
LRRGRHIRKKADMTIHSAGTPAAKPGTPEAKPEVETGGGGFKRALIVILVVLASAGIAYGFGRLQTSSKIDAAEQKAAEAEKTAAAVEARVLRLEARRRLHLALVQLEQRNFGIAEQHLTAAGALLEKSKPEADLGQLRTELAGARLKASDDIAAQRAKIAAWAARFDELSPPAAP